MLLMQDQVHADDISNVLILNKKSIANQESQLFKAELEKFRPHQNRILQANHKQASLLKELTRTYSDLLKDKRVRSEQTKYEAYSRQRNTVMTKHRRVYQAFNDLISGLMRAQGFYSEMKETVASLKQNVETFVNNRRAEGGSLLSRIEESKSSGADQEQQRLKDLMARMSMEPSGSPVSAGGSSGQRKKSIPAPISTAAMSQPGYPSTSSQPQYNPATSPPVTPRYPITANPGGQQPYMSPQQGGGYQQPPQQPQQRNSYQTTTHSQFSHHPSQSTGSYNPNSYGPVSPPPHQQYFSPPPNQPQQPPQPWGQPPTQQQHYAGGHSSLPQGYVPPPPPPGPPPSQTPDYSQYAGGAYPGGPGGYAAVGQRQSQQGGQQGQGGQPDPWAGLSGWK